MIARCREGKAAVQPPYNPESLSNPLAGNSSEKRIVSVSKILAVAEHDLEAAQNANLCLHSSIPQPFWRSEISRWIRNCSRVEKRTGLYGNEFVLVCDLVQVKIQEAKISPQRGVAFLSVAQTGVSAQPKIIIAIETKDEKLIEGQVSERPACLEISFHYVILAARSREPNRGNASIDAAVLAERSFEKCANFSAGVCIQRKSSLRNSGETAFNAGAKSNRRSIGKEGSSGRRYREQVAKIPVRVFNAGVPPPQAVLDKLNLCASRCFFQIQVRPRRDRGNQRVCEVPIFVSSVEIDTVSNGGIFLEWRGDFGEYAPLL